MSDAGNAYRGVLDRARMRGSMSRADNCYDNAFMESCFGTIKRELEMEPYETERIARAEIGGYLRYYNTRRLHSSLGYMTPEAFEALNQTPQEPPIDENRKSREVIRLKMKNQSSPKR